MNHYFGVSETAHQRRADLLADAERARLAHVARRRSVTHPQPRSHLRRWVVLRFRFA